MTTIEEKCACAGVPAAEAARIEQAVAAFNSEDVRQRAVEELIAAYHRSQAEQAAAQQDADAEASQEEIYEADGGDTMHDGSHY